MGLRKKPDLGPGVPGNEAILNDSALVEGLRRRDPDAVQHLSECCLPAVWRFVYVRVKGDRHLAEDIVSEAVLALIRAAADPTVEIGNPAGWMRSVAANKIVDHFRAAARVQHLIDQAKQSTLLLDDQDAGRKQELLEHREEIRQVLDDLPEQTRMALEWKYIDKQCVKVIAERLEVTEKAAESILFRGRREFRERMQKMSSLDESFSEQECIRCNGIDRRVAKKPCETDQQPVDEDGGSIQGDPASTGMDQAFEATKLGQS